MRRGVKALEIGTGSGYQAAVLAELGHAGLHGGNRATLAEQAAARLTAAGYRDVEVRQGDGYFGWPEAAPFDGIVVTAAASQIPPPLLEQLKPDGRMVIPDRRRLPGATAGARRKARRRDDTHRGPAAGSLRAFHTPRVAIPMLAAIALLSAGAIAYELLLTRLFAITLWHHFAYMVISLALLGYGASGTFLVFAGRFLLPRFGLSFAGLAAAFGVTAIGCYGLAWRLPFNPLEVIWDWRQQLYLAAMYLTLALPFFAAANAIGLALPPDRRPSRPSIVPISPAQAPARRPSWWPCSRCRPRTACACLQPGRSCPQHSPSRRTDGGAWHSLSRVSQCRRRSLAGRMAEADPSPYKALSLALNVPGTQVITERSSPLGRLSVIESRSVPLRHAPGLSLATTVVPPEQLGIFTDGEGMTAVTRFTGDVATLRFLDQQTGAVPYHLLDRPATLVLGAGGGADVLMALHRRRGGSMRWNSMLNSLISCAAISANSRDGSTTAPRSLCTLPKREASSRRAKRAGT